MKVRFYLSYDRKTTLKSHFCMSENTKILPYIYFAIYIYICIYIGHYYGHLYLMLPKSVNDLLIVLYLAVSYFGNFRLHRI